MQVILPSGSSSFSLIRLGLLSGLACLTAPGKPRNTIVAQFVVSSFQLSISGLSFHPFLVSLFLSTLYIYVYVETTSFPFPPSIFLAFPHFSSICMLDRAMQPTLADYSSSRVVSSVSMRSVPRDAHTQEKNMEHV